MSKHVHSLRNGRLAAAFSLVAALLGSGSAGAQSTVYCTTGLGGSCGGNNISAVSLTGTTLNATGLTCASVGGQAYTSYPATGANTGTIAGGTPYTLGVTLAGPSIVSVWIDYNRNFSYEATEWTQVATNSPTGTPVTVSLLVPANAVQGTTGLRVRSRLSGNTNGAADACAPFGSGETKDFTVTIGAPAACPAVSGIAATNVTTTGATVSFTPVAAATTYTLTVTPAGGPATTQTVTASPATLTGLTPSTAYTVSIVSNCGAGQVSAANSVVFATGCAGPVYVAVSNTTPYTQDFEAAWLSVCGANDVPAANWRNAPLTGNASWRRDDNGASANWTTPTAGVYTPPGSPLSGGTSLHSARFHSYDVAGRGTGTLDVYLNMAGTAGTPTLVFDYVNTSGSDSLSVLVSTNGGTTFSARSLARFTLANDWTRQTVNLPATGLTATTVLRLRGTGDFGFSDIGVDNVRVAYVTCPAVTGAAATGITTTGATIGFSPVSAATTYAVTLTPAGGTATTQTVAASPVTLTGLTPGTAYTVSIVSNCGGGLTSQPAVVSFSASAVAPANDDCAGALTVPIQFGTCIGQTSADNTAATNSASPPPPACANYMGKDIWFKVTVPVSGSVTVQTVAPTAGSAITDTGLSMYSGACGTLTEIGCNDDANGFYSELVFTGRTPGEVLYIRAWAYGGTDTGLIAVCATSPSNCAPPAGPTATNLTNTTAQLNWAAPTGGLVAGNTYSLEYGPQNFSQGSGTLVTGLTTNSYALTNLQANTAYCYYVRQNCGATNGSSAYVGPACFSTPLTVPGNDEPCGAVALTGAGSVSGSNVGATTSVQNGINTPACSPAPLPKDVWFHFAPAGASATLTFTGTAAGMVRVFTSPDCAAGPFAQVFCQGVAANTNVGPVSLAGLTPGRRYYVAVSGYGGSDATGPFTVSGTSLLAVSARAETAALVVYPNPSGTGQLTLRLAAAGQPGRATLLNALGQRVRSAALVGGAEQPLSTRGLAPGVYTLRVESNGQLLTRKVVLE